MSGDTTPTPSTDQTSIYPESVSSFDLDAESLPDLLDKSGFHETVDSEFTMAQQTGSPLSVVFIDADHFKSINDTLGHDEGDRVIADIKAMVRIVTGSTMRQEQPNDAPQSENSYIITQGNEYELGEVEVEHELVDATGGHIGGDEFGIVVRADSEITKLIISRLQETFGNYLNLPGNSKLRELGVGLSFGSATLNSAIKTSSDLLAKADEAMYLDKLSNLNNLTEHQLKALRGAIFLLREAGIRLRDVPKYLLLHKINEEVTEVA